MSGIASINVLDHGAVRRVMDEVVDGYIGECGFVDDTRWSNTKLAIMAAACALALFAQFCPTPFPDSRAILAACCIAYPCCCGLPARLCCMRLHRVRSRPPPSLRRTYVLCSAAVQLIMWLHDKDYLMIAMPSVLPAVFVAVFVIPDAAARARMPPAPARRDGAQGGLGVSTV